MSYQFDPRPDGLHYEPFYATFSHQAMWYVRDGAPQPWIDLRSVFGVLLASWTRRWRGYCEASRAKWSLESCCDKRMRDTLLAPAHRVPAILGEIEAQLLRIGQRTAANRTRELRLQWRAIYEIIQTGAPRIAAAESGRNRRSARRRKINAYVVRQVFALLGKGHKKPAIALALQISLGTVQQLAAGTYPLRGESMDAWWATFGGAQSTPTKQFEGPKNAARHAGGRSASPMVSVALQRVSCGLEEIAG